MKTFLRLLPLLFLSALACQGATPAKTNGPASRFGFGGPEIFPVDYQIAHLHAADFDGDGLND